MSGCQHPSPNQNPLQHAALPSESRGLLSFFRITLFAGSSQALRHAEMLSFPRSFAAQIRSDQIRSDRERVAPRPISSNQTHSRYGQDRRPAWARSTACKWLDAGRLSDRARSTLYGLRWTIYSISAVKFSCCETLAWAGRSGAPCYPGTPRTSSTLLRSGPEGRTRKVGRLYGDPAPSANARMLEYQLVYNAIIRV